MSLSPYYEQQLTGWGRLNPHSSRVYRVARRCELRACLSQTQPGGVIARGQGRSYGDCATLEHGAVVLSERLNRLLAFDPRSGLLTCETGVTLADIIQTFVPRGYFLPVTPGTRYVSVGGAIAADIHGKNHHRAGSFGNFVESLELWTGRNELLRCTRNENTDVFWATIGGLGLTGYIISASLRLMPIETSFLRVDRWRVGNLDELLKLFDDLGNKYSYLVAWVDCLARDDKLGRAVLHAANHALRAELPKRVATLPLSLGQQRNLSVFLPPFALVRSAIASFNEWYFRTHPNRSNYLKSLEDFFFPMDRLRRWNQVCGRRGLVQYQALFPTETAADGVRKTLEAISASGEVPLLAVLKRTGPQNRGLLSFGQPGITLSVDLPNTGAALQKLGQKLDKVLLDHGGRLYLAADALSTPQAVTRMYPRLDEFRQVKAQIDPKGKFISDLALRLRLVA